MELIDSQVTSFLIPILVLLRVHHSDDQILQLRLVLSMCRPSLLHAGTFDHVFLGFFVARLLVHVLKVVDFADGTAYLVMYCSIDHDIILCVNKNDLAVLLVDCSLEL